MDDFDGFEALSFDCYGTLIDWEYGIVEALGAWAADAGLSLGPDQLLAAHATHETHVQHDMPTRPYPEVLAETLRRIGADCGVLVTAEDAAAYGASVGEWPPFPDSAPALKLLADRFRLVILSNVDRASFARSNERLGVTFDLIVTAEDVGSYKPDPAGFRFMFDRLTERGIASERVLHVAESLYHDHEPALSLGMRTVWIHRRHDKSGSGATAPPRGDVSPTWRFTSMEAFAAAATR